MRGKLILTALVLSFLTITLFGKPTTYPQGPPPPPPCNPYCGGH
jgi:hypothetical protein